MHKCFDPGMDWHRSPSPSPCACRLDRDHTHKEWWDLKDAHQHEESK